MTKVRGWLMLAIITAIAIKELTRAWWDNDLRRRAASTERDGYDDAAWLDEHPIDTHACTADCDND